MNKHLCFFVIEKNIKWERTSWDKKTFSNHIELFWEGGFLGLFMCPKKSNGYPHAFGSVPINSTLKSI
jgi:hypothetical protein